MKPTSVIGLCALSALVAFAIQEARIASLRQSSPAAATITPVSAKTVPTAASAPDPAPSARPRPRTDASPSGAAEAAAKDDSLMTSARKLWDNPAGKSMMSQQAKMAVGMIYQDFIDSLGLSKEEAEHFKALLGKEIADQQEVGFKLMAASPDERKALAKELEERGKQTQEDIRKFLNDEEDYKAFTDYKERLPERQQIAGISAALDAKGVPLDDATEARLIESMHRARTTTGSADLSGAAGMEQLAQGKLTETFEKNWQTQQDALLKDAGTYLNPDQMTALQEQQKQFREMQLIGLKMAEKMMSGKSDK